jgi:hypothetical protein
MKRVFFNEQSEQDLSDTVIGLLLWKKVTITEEEALRYADDVYEMAQSIPYLLQHKKCQYDAHEQYGKYQLKYRRNRRTTWYIIYDIEHNSGNILIELIV